MLNEDAHLASRAKHIYAVSDGASESFASRRWSRILVSCFLRKADITQQTLIKAIAKYESGFDRPNMSWSAQASYDRGSYATMLGVQIFDDGASILGIGDSLAVLADGSSIKATFPYVSANQFHANPLLLSTIPDRNEGVLEEEITTFWSFAGLEQPIVYAMTDALGAWLLADGHQRLSQIQRLTSQHDFDQLVLSARADATMRTDDTTLIVIG
ncbi:hypothetical protein [Hyphomonas oceanitis]|uniref:hypothetical protein n=1 Tax=Hyphomonas oceanitis TaxID=81033 RepID=UPI0030036D3D